MSEALALLAGYYERIGSEGDLVDLLAQAFDAALAARDPAMVVAAAIRLGGVLERTDAERAAATYERALAVAPRRGELLKRLLALRPAGEATREHAELMEAVLDVETGAEAGTPGARAGGRLDDPRRRGGRAARAREGLRAGAGRAGRSSRSWNGCIAASRTGLRSRISTPPRPSAASDAKEAAALFVEAASLRRGRLADVRGGLELLRRARTRAPQDIQIVEQLARALVAHGELGAAVAEVRAALEDGHLAQDQRLPLHLLRAKLEAANGDHRAAVTVLEEAFVLSPDAAGAAARRGAGGVAQGRRGRERDRGSAGRDAAARGARARRGRSAAGAAAARRAGRARRGGRRDGAPDLGAGGGRRATRRARSAAAQHFVRARGRRGADRGRPASWSRSPKAWHSVRAPRRRSRRRSRAHPDQLGLVDILAPLYEQTGELGKLAGLLLDQGNRNADERAALRAAPSRRRVRHPGAGRIARRHGAQRGAGRAVPPTRRRRCCCRTPTCWPARSRKRPRWSTPLVAARKGKASPALAALHLRLARIAGPRRGSRGGAGRAGPRAGRRQEERRAGGRGRRPRRGGRRRRAGAEGVAVDRRARRRRARSACPTRSCARHASRIAAARPSAPSCSPDAPRTTRPRTIPSTSRRARSWTANDAAPAAPRARR